MIQFKSIHPLNGEKVFNRIEGKLAQSSVNGLLNNSSSRNPLPLLDIMEVDTLKGKCFGQTTNQDSHCHGNLLFLSSA